MPYDKLAEKKKYSEHIFSGNILNVYKDTVVLPNGKDATREYIHHIGAACIVPITDDGNVVVERQFRYPFGQITLEIPAGKLNSPNEDPELAVRRELAEETGAVADEITFLGKLYPTVAYSDEIIYMFMARGISFETSNPDDDEFLDVELIPLDELVNEIMKGNVPDAKTQAAVLKAYFLIKNEA